MNNTEHNLQYKVTIKSVTDTSAILTWHCICSGCTIVTLALPNPHPSLSSTGEQ